MYYHAVDATVPVHCTDAMHPDGSGFPALIMLIVSGVMRWANTLYTRVRSQSQVQVMHHDPSPELA